MKILLTADPEIPVPPVLYGGIERIVELLIKGYVSRGHDVTLMAHPDSNVPCRHIAWKGLLSHGTGNILRNTATLAATVLKGRFDIVHSFSRLGYLTPILPFAVPKIMSYQREPSLQQVAKANRLSRKGSLLFTGCSNYITNQLTTVATAKTVYNGVEMEKYQLIPYVDADAPLAFLGRIEPIKGTHIAVQVAIKTGKRLVIAGNIPKEGTQYFEEKIRPFLNDRICYIGPVNDVQKNALLGRSAAFLMPIQWNEPFGIVMAEAMACGTPVLGFPFGSVPEVVRDGVNGFICKDEDEMCNRVHDVLLLDRNLVWKDADARFSSHAIVDEYLAAYACQLEKQSQKILKTA